ncbi:rRNA methyltransferase 1, mitochondrial-like, partial [Phalaenopsis equestris]|uniref:rRNA methyltransferase 1, mitochondrial-like n=1 Tax=Phalaenopsis equestris TaxID=78828 RepID=UPI0009E4DABF
MLPPHCCNLARNLSLPLISRVSRRPVSFSVSLSQAASVSCAAERSTAIDPAGRAIDTRVLPGLVSRRGRGQKTPVGKRIGFRSNFSSWEESAEAYFSRNGVKLRDEREDGYRRRRSLGDTESENGVSAEVREEETQGKQELVSKSADSPRWNRIKNMHRDFSDSSSRSEKPYLRRWNKRETWSKPRSKEATETSVPKMVGQCVYGVGPVLAALTAARREFHALYVQQGLDITAENRKKKKKDKKGVAKILKLADKLGLTVIEASKHDLNMVVENRPHQGLLLDASPLEIVDIKELEAVAGTDQRAPLWVALDEVTDPQNLGAIIRSAYFFGAEGVVLCAKNSAPLSGVVGKASAGSLELIELRSCKNMMRFLGSSMENGWRVLGGSVSFKALSLREVEAGLPTILVLGSEGHGLRPLVERCCSQLIRIPGIMAVDGVN